MSPMWIAGIFLLTLSQGIAYNYKPSTQGSGTLANPLWSGLRVKFSPNGVQDGFIQLPRTAADARRKGYTQPPEEPVTDVSVLCKNRDPSVCIMYDKKGNIAGMQIGVQKRGLSTQYPFDQRPSFVFKTRYGHKMYITTLFFVSQQVLRSGGRSSLSQHGTGMGLWLQEGHDRRNLIEIPRYEKDTRRTLFKRQGCVNGMGLHYYFNVNEQMSCNDFFPIFGLYKNGEMVGFGFKAFGKQTPIGTTWFESIPAGAIRVSVPNAPQCLVDAAATTDIVSLHVYFGESPWDISCEATAE